MVTVKDALKKGQKTINIPVFIIMFGVISLLFYFSAGTKKIHFLFTPFSFLIGPLFAWLYWSKTIVLWKVWAFKNVRNVHELKKKAIRNGLIWRDDSVFNKTEIWSKSQKKEWEIILKKFNKPDNIKDDLFVPKETIISYSKTVFIINLCFSFLGIGVSLYLYLSDKNNILLPLLFLGSSIYLLFSTYKKFKKPFKIILNEKGIKTSNSPFLKWNNVEDLNIYREGYGKNIKFYLSFGYFESTNDVEEFFEEKIDLSDFTLNYEEIEDLIKIYKLRHKKYAM